MLFTEFGITTAVRLVQLSKVSSPMLVTEFEITTEARFVQSVKAKFPIFITPSSKITD